MKNVRVELDRCNEWCLKLLKEQHDVVLDVGCGDGETGKAFMSKVGARKVFGVDYCSDVADRAQANGVLFSSFNLNLPWAFSDNMFGLILSSQNIEHISNQRVYLEECLRCLKPGGELLVISENLASWPNIISLLFGWMPFSLTAVGGWILGNPLSDRTMDPHTERIMNLNRLTDGVGGHCRVLTRLGLSELLERVGFCDVRTWTRGYIPLSGKLSDLMCCIDRQHGHFLVCHARKPLIDGTRTEAKLRS